MTPPFRNARIHACTCVLNQATIMTAEPPSAPPAQPFSACVQAAMDVAISECTSEALTPSTSSSSSADDPPPPPPSTTAAAGNGGLPPGLRARRAVSSDVASIMVLVRGLAEYEKEPADTVAIDEKTLLRDGFGPEPLFYVLLVEREGEEGGAEAMKWKAVGFGLFVFMYSTWEGRVMFLEDLFIVEQERRNGIGRHLFVVLAKVARALDCARFQWMALDWNTPALTFYAKLGAPLLDPAWRSLRMNRQQIEALATGNPSSLLKS